MIWRAIVLAQLLVLDLAALVWALVAGPPEKDAGSHLAIPLILGMLVLILSAVLLLGEIVEDVRDWLAERRRQKDQLAP